LLAPDHQFRVTANGTIPFSPIKLGAAGEFPALLVGVLAGGDPELEGKAIIADRFWGRS
tara:strand:+ start:1807 stop:1983 length:177 start_codon:yes stop_codon:yes gene_type:complete